MDLPLEQLYHAPSLSLSLGRDLQYQHEAYDMMNMKMTEAITPPDLTPQPHGQAGLLRWFVRYSFWSELDIIILQTRSRGRKVLMCCWIALTFDASFGQLLYGINYHNRPWDSDGNLTRRTLLQGRAPVGLMGTILFWCICTFP